MQEPRGGRDEQADDRVGPLGRGTRYNGGGGWIGASGSGRRRPAWTAAAEGDHGRRRLPLRPADDRWVARLPGRRSARSRGPVLARSLRSRVGPGTRGGRQRGRRLALGARRHGGVGGRLPRTGHPEDHGRDGRQPVHDLRHRRRRDPPACRRAARAPGRSGGAGDLRRPQPPRARTPRSTSTTSGTS